MSVKSLRDICQDQLAKHIIGKIETVHVLQVANDLQLSELRTECIRTIRFKFDFFKDNVEDDYLRELLNDEEMEDMERASRERKRFSQYIKQEGKILSNASTPFSTISASDASGERVFFPIDALVSGVKWPDGIDPTKREEWLNDEDFERVFRMSKDGFRALGRFHKERLKKDAKLW